LLTVLCADDEQPGRLPVVTPLACADEEYEPLEETSDDVSLTQPAKVKSGVKRKKTSHMVVKKQRSALPPPPTASFGVGQRVNASPNSGPPDTNLVFFSSMAHLTTCINTKEKLVDMASFEDQIRQLASYKLYPLDNSLTELIESTEETDVKVSLSAELLIHYLTSSSL
jgi:hypothetical protein